MCTLEKEVQVLPGIGEKRAALFHRLGINTLHDILHFFPRDYEDFTQAIPISQAALGQIVCVLVTVTALPTESFSRKGVRLCKVSAADESSTLEVVFFNNPYAGRLLKKGKKYYLRGRIGGTNFKRNIISPECVSADENPGLRPVYATTAGLTSRLISTTVRAALSFCAKNPIQDPLSTPLRETYRLCSLCYALEKIHFPQDWKTLAVARKRLAFEELLTLMLGMGLLRGRGDQAKAIPCNKEFDFSSFYRLLPFEPTMAQRRAITEAAADMTRTTPMNRLIEGDVGSGKTTVAAALCMLAHVSGLQSVLMAPTEILAAQHARKLEALLQKGGMRVGLLTGGMPVKKKKEIKQELATGKIHLVVGTHALLQEDVAFARLGLVVTDEQHRFGVAQRALLAAKGRNPHTLIMSATPIPRTLSLMIYGDLDLSVLNELPAGRKSIETYLINSSLHKRLYRFLRGKMEKGLQAYIVCPLVETDDEGTLVSAVGLHDRLARTEFADFHVGLLHGKMPAKEKQAVMQAFATGEIQLLVSTTVIEVGVDVPAAVVMVIENAERFGLSQLHQLRGRVGRGSEQSYCILVSDIKESTSRERLNVLCKTTDGFAVAERDLALRGPGDFFGKRQHGLPALAIADLMKDMRVLQSAREAANALLKDDPYLKKTENQLLRKAVNSLYASQDIVFN